MNSGLTSSPTPGVASPLGAVGVASPLGAVGVPAGLKLKFCRYYAKDKTCFYGDECQFLHEDPLGMHSTSSSPLSLSGGPAVGYPPPGTSAGKKLDLGGHPVPGLDTQRLAIPGLDGSLSDTSINDSYFSSSFMGMNGFGNPAEQSYQRMPRMTNSSSSPSLLNDSAKAYAAHDPLGTPASTLFNDFSGLSMSQRRKAPNPTASEFIPKGGSSSRLSNMSQSSMAAFSQALFSHPPIGSSAAAGLAPGMSLSAGSSPLHSPKITPHTSPAPRRRSHTPNLATYMVPTSASTPVTNSVSQPPSAGQVIQKETVGGTTYFYTDTTPAPLSGMELMNRHLITMAQMEQSEMPGVPPEVDNYHSLFPLEPLPPPNRIHKSSNFGFTTSCYKAVNSKDDLTYCLRRVHGFRLVNTKCMSLVDTWKKVQHSNIVSLREVFTTKAFGEHSLVFAYDFHAGSETMMSRHFNDPSADGYFTKRKWGQHDGPLPRQHAGLLPESLIWAYIVQLSSALRTTHTAGLACRVMDPSKILISGKSRLRINCVGICDVLTYDGSQNPVALMPQYQQADLISLGKVVLALACNSLAGIQRENLQKAMELVTINYSSDLKNLILYLLTDQNRLRSVNDIMPMIGARFYTQLDSAQMRNDVIEEDLAKEVQNGRLFRLLAKLGTINERPEFQKDPAWSETGDRYLLKLFRDHLFHQVTETGTPWIDLSHIVSCLNKLDAGVPEKISLISRDEKSVLVTLDVDPRSSHCLTCSSPKQLLHLNPSRLPRVLPLAASSVYTPRALPAAANGHRKSSLQKEHAG
uniref:PAN2-PAN3 deadenylation complex subunit PAN3 n=1 Tax=Leptobrachium leishanense TaxID=445787 RepID=A0A8C5Q0L8_9ANUR